MLDEHRFNMRLPQPVIDEIDRQRKRAAGKVSRNTWICEAIQEKIQREGGKATSTVMPGDDADA